MRPSNYSRRQLRLQFAGWARRNARVVLSVAGIAVFMLILATIMFVGFLEQLGGLRWYLLGVIHTVTIGFVPWSLFGVFVMSNPKALSHLKGAWGEENTQDILKRAKRKRLVWGWADSIDLAFGDIDHLVVTRHGGLIAIDSKWRNTFDPGDRDAMARSAEKARLRASGVVDTVLRRGGHGQRSAGTSVRIRPVVVIWGALQREIPEAAQAHGVDFVAGGKLIGWLKQLDGDSIDEESAAELLKRVAEFQKRTATANVKS